MESQIIKRSFTVENFRAEAVEGKSLPDLVGHAAVFNEPIDLYWFTESIAPGAFKACLERGDDVRALFNHDPNFVLGRNPKTLSMNEDGTGLLVRISPPDTQLGRDMVVSIGRGDISQMSFAFWSEKEEMDDSEDREKPHFTIKQAKLFDVSPVTFPAYPTTDIGVDRARGVTKEEFEARCRRALAARNGSADPAAAKQLRERRLQLLLAR
jgi:hypothetical protein